MIVAGLVWKVHCELPLFSGSTVSWKSWTQTMTRSSAKMSSGAEKARQTMSFWHLFDKGTENREIAKCLLWLFHFLLPQWCFHADSVCEIICKSQFEWYFSFVSQNMCWVMNIVETAENLVLFLKFWCLIQNRLQNHFTCVICQSPRMGDGWTPQASHVGSVGFAGR